MSSLAKKLLFPLLPSGVLRMLRSKYYLKKFAELTGEDEPEMKVIRSLIKEGDTVLDIGANFGTYTKFLSSVVGGRGGVEAFEPIPEVFGYLKSNIDSTGIRNVRLHNHALSDASGTAQFSIPKFDHSGENFYEGHLTESDGDITVQVKTVDELNFSNPISFVKCDVEGAELKVLHGSKEMIKLYKPIWMLEINTELTEPGAMEIINFMSSQGYQMKYMANGLLTDQKPTTHGVNYFFIPA